MEGGVKLIPSNKLLGSGAGGASATPPIDSTDGYAGGGCGGSPFVDSVG